MGEVLSQSEIDNLLKALSSGELDGPWVALPLLIISSEMRLA